MDRADALASCNRSLLRAFSRHVAVGLNDRLPVRMALPWLEHFLNQNVAKEIKKDTLVIRRAGAPLGADAVRELLAAARDVDRHFLRNVAGIPVDIVIRYDEIEPIRRQRIERLGSAAHAVLSAWPDGRGARSACQAAYPRAELERQVHELLHLYARETRALAGALHMPMLLAPLRDRLARALYEVMTEAAGVLARRAGQEVFRRRPAA
ncbi:hypothetical protein [Parasulfuritortus cantonensis]|uniref:hypothetical protein n=1 Tax=Parasulfuritortus cantonensis TaxID=2528202 RepID=UPI001404CE40|nr:hypothetical protein [Parasulfuritortus cantonensis]